MRTHTHLFKWWLLRWGPPFQIGLISRHGDDNVCCCSLPAEACVQGSLPESPMASYFLNKTQTCEIGICKSHKPEFCFTAINKCKPLLLAPIMSLSHPPPPAREAC